MADTVRERVVAEERVFNAGTPDVTDFLKHQVFDLPKFLSFETSKEQVSLRFVAEIVLIFDMYVLSMSTIFTFQIKRVVSFHDRKVFSKFV